MSLKDKRLPGKMIIKNGLVTSLTSNVPDSAFRKDGDVGEMLHNLNKHGWRIVGDYEIDLELLSDTTEGPQ